ncbi:MAG: hypothetical protein H7A51_08345 [Akkermansiaceae bacterium]|nr:hypothetical protein [Akkermansiaceae bacterium]
MHKNSKPEPLAPFKAKLRHYHRTASPALYSRKQKRWEDVSPAELGDASVADSHVRVDLGKRLSGDAKSPESTS